MGRGRVGMGSFLLRSNRRRRGRRRQMDRAQTLVCHYRLCREALCFGGNSGGIRR